MKKLRLVLALLLVPVAAAAAPPDLSGFRWVQHPGAQVPAATPFRGDDGAEMRLKDLGHGPPIILALGYYHCPNLCGLVRSTLMRALSEAALDGGQDYSLAVVSIDPAEGPADARSAKAADLHAFSLPGAGAWHYLTGNADEIAAVTRAVGYDGRFDAALKQFVHPTGLVILTPSGRISSYLLGLNYRAGDLKVALARARQGSIQAAASPVLLLCFHYDSTTGRYTLSILKLLKLAAALTVVVVLAVGVLLFRHERRA